MVYENFTNIYGVETVRYKRTTTPNNHLRQKKGIPPTTAGRLQRWALLLLLMGYSFSIEYKSTKVFGNTDGLSRLPTGPDLFFDGQNHGNVNITESVNEEKLDDLPVKPSDIAIGTSKDPVLKQVKRFVLKGWPKQAPCSLFSPQK